MKQAFKEGMKQINNEVKNMSKTTAQGRSQPYVPQQQQQQQPQQPQPNQPYGPYGDQTSAPPPYGQYGAPPPSHPPSNQYGSQVHPPAYGQYAASAPPPGGYYPAPVPPPGDHYPAPAPPPGDQTTAQTPLSQPPQYSPQAPPPDQYPAAPPPSDEQSPSGQTAQKAPPQQGFPGTGQYPEPQSYPTAPPQVNPGGPGHVAPSNSAGGRYGIQEFVNATAQVNKGQGIFELERPTLLEVNLRNEMAYLKIGTMVAYRGNVKFTRASSLKQGAAKMMKKFVTGEGVTMTEASGTGKVFVAEESKKITILNLSSQESISCNGNDILAFTNTIKWDIKFVKGGAGMIAGGMTNVFCQGPGMVAITSHGDAITLMVGPNNPVTTDPNATVAWSGNLTPQLKTDVSMKSLMGRSSGEEIQLAFASNSTGWVVIQPYEEVAFQAASSGPPQTGFGFGL